MSGGVQRAKGWETYQAGAGAAGLFSRWPNEAMVKVLFGSYLGTRRAPAAGERVLDVGCGFGQNLLPFVNCGCEAAGVELTASMIAEAAKAMQQRGVRVDFRVGANRAIPFEDGAFDLVLSINTIHYESNEAHYLAALGEFARVLKPGGRLYVSTVGPRHEIRTRAEPLGGHRFRIRDYDFRNGEIMFFLDHERELADAMSRHFAAAETGQVTERLMTRTLDFFIGVATKAA